jgi:hypothetical protein
LTVWTFLEEARDPGQIKPALGGPTLSGVGDEEFADYIASRLAGLRGVAAVSLGGSRASGASRPDSDWDFSRVLPRSFRSR